MLSFAFYTRAQCRHHVHTPIRDTTTPIMAYCRNVTNSALNRCGCEGEVDQVKVTRHDRRQTLVFGLWVVKIIYNVSPARVALAAAATTTVSALSTVSTLWWGPERLKDAGKRTGSPILSQVGSCRGCKGKCRAVSLKRYWPDGVFNTTTSRTTGCHSEPTVSYIVKIMARKEMYFWMRVRWLL